MPVRSERQCPEGGPRGGGVAGRAAYNEFWWDRGNKIVGTKRTSLIVDPPMAGSRHDARRTEASGPHLRRANDTNLAAPRRLAGRPPLAERSYPRFNSGPPMTPALQQQCRAVPGSRICRDVNEMIHDTRIVPLDGVPMGTSAMEGDSRGHWKRHAGVDRSTSARDEFPELRELAPRREIHPHDADTLMYEFTINDPSV